MKRHRGLFLGLALSALVGLSASQAHAETISLAVTFTGTSGLQTYTQTGSGTSMSTILTALNTQLATAGSAYSFSSLDVTSNNPGTFTADGGYLKVGGTLNALVSPGLTGTISIVATEDGYTAPTGPVGTLLASSTTNYSSALSGSSEVFTGQFNSTMAAPQSYALLGTASSSMNVPKGIGAVATGYVLTDTLALSLGHNTVSQASNTFSGTSMVTAVPEPASLVMMLTGMPLPLVVLGLLRRRRRAAA